MPKDSITIVEAELSVEEIAKALRITPKDAVAKFQDPRVTSWFAEIWGERLFGYRKHLSSNHPGSDARIELGAIGRFEISVRCFNRGTIKFQKSKHIGSGRSATADDLIESVEDVERVVVVDLRRFPRLRFVPLDSKALLRLIRLGRLTTTGISPGRFDAWLAEPPDVSRRRDAGNLRPGEPAMATIALLSACVCVLCAIMLCASVHAIYLGVAVKSPHLGTEARVIAIQGVFGVVASIVALSFLYYLGGT